MIRLILVALLFPLVAIAQTVDTSTVPPGFVDRFLTPAGVATVLGMVLSAVAAFQFFTAKRKKILALAVYHAFHIVEDIGAELEGEDGFDKTATFLKAINDLLVKQGYRPLKPGEMDVATLEAKALHGGEIAKAKVLETAIATQVAAAKVASPQ
jgi:hypothetical protein